MPRVQKDDVIETTPPPTFSSIVGGGDYSDSPAPDPVTPIDPDEENSVQRVYTTTPSIDRSKMTIPRLRLAQGQTPEVHNGTAKQGEWILLGAQSVKELIILPYAYNFSRSYRPNINEAPLCQSPDGVKGIGTPGILCRQCPHSQWRTNEQTGKRMPPACGEVYSYLSYSPLHDAVCTLDLRGTAVRAAQEINMLIEFKKFGNFALKLTSEQKQNAAKQVYYVPTTAGVDVPLEHLPRVRQLMIATGHPIEALPALPEASGDYEEVPEDA